MRKLTPRTRVLLSLLAVVAGMSIATVFVVRRAIEDHLRETLRDDLHRSVNAFSSFDRQRQLSLSQTAALLSGLPSVRAVVAAQDPAAVQAVSGKLEELSDTDIFLVADRTARIAVLRSRNSTLTQDMAQQLLVRSLARGEPRDLWTSGDHLYEMWIQPVSQGRPPHETSLGILAVGHEIDDSTSREFANSSGIEVAFRSGGAIVASTLAPSRRAALRIATSAIPVTLGPAELQLEGERYLASSVSLLNGSTSPVSLIVLKSLDQATVFLQPLNLTLLCVGLAFLLGGALLALLVSSPVAHSSVSDRSKGAKALPGAIPAAPAAIDDEYDNH